MIYKELPNTERNKRVELVLVGGEPPDLEAAGITVPLVLFLVVARVGQQVSEIP